jgi:hypothetical protein
MTPGEAKVLGCLVIAWASTIFFLLGFGIGWLLA